MWAGPSITKEGKETQVEMIRESGGREEQEVKAQEEVEDGEDFNVRESPRGGAHG